MNEEKRPINVPYVAYEKTMSRFERIIKYLIIALCIAIMALVGTNLAWLYVFNSYDIYTEGVSVDSKDGGNANYIGKDGVINNGESSSQEKSLSQEGK